MTKRQKTIYEVHEWLEKELSNKSENKLFYDLAIHKNKNVRGICAIVGSANAKSKLSSIFQDILKFEIVQYANFAEAINKESERDHSPYKCFVLIVLRTSENYFYKLEKSNRSKPYNYHEFGFFGMLKDFTKPETNLNGKPKLIFIQDNFDDSNDVDGSYVGGQFDWFINVKEIKHFSTFSDFALFHNSFPTENFINTLYETIEKLHQTHDLVSMYTKVVSQLKENTYHEGILQMPYVHSTLTRLLTFSDKDEYSKIEELSYGAKSLQICQSSKILRGKCVIINLETYEDNWQKSRKRTVGLGVKIAKTFHNLGFNVKHYFEKNKAEESINNTTIFIPSEHERLTRSEILKILENEMNNDSVEEYDYFALWVLTHGDLDGKLYCYNRGESILISEILKPLTVAKFNGKPKLVFIQACKGGNADPGIQVISDTVLQKNDLFPIPSDTLVCYSQYPGHLSTRPYMTYAVCGVLDYYLKKPTDEGQMKYDLMTLLTIATHFVSYELFNETWKMKHTLYLNSTLCKLIDLL